MSFLSPRTVAPGTASQRLASPLMRPDTSYQFSSGSSPTKGASTYSSSVERQASVDRLLSSITIPQGASIAVERRASTTYPSLEREVSAPVAFPQGFSNSSAAGSYSTSLSSTVDRQQSMPMLSSSAQFPAAQGLSSAGWKIPPLQIPPVPPALAGPGSTRKSLERQASSPVTWDAPTVVWDGRRPFAKESRATYSLSPTGGSRGRLSPARDVSPGRWTDFAGNSSRTYLLEGQEGAPVVCTWQGLQGAGQAVGEKNSSMTPLPDLLSSISSLLREHEKQVVSHLEQHGQTLEQMKMQLGQQAQLITACSQACGSKQAKPQRVQVESPPPKAKQQLQYDQSGASGDSNGLVKEVESSPIDDAVTEAPLRGLAIPKDGKDPREDTLEERARRLEQLTKLRIMGMDLGDNDDMQAAQTLQAPLLPKSSSAEDPEDGTKDDEQAEGDEDEDDEEGTVIPEGLRWLGRQSATTRMASLFPQSNVEESNIRKKHYYDVEDFYHETGCAQGVARHELFKEFMVFGTLANAIWIGVETDYNKGSLLGNGDPIFEIGDNIFCIVFVFEIIVRFMAFKKKSVAFTDPWFVFDTALVFMMVLNSCSLAIYSTFIGGEDASGNMMQHSQFLRIVRLVRLVKVARSARLLHSIPEFSVLLYAMAHGIRSLLAVWAMMMVTIYAFGVLFAMLLADSEIGEGVFDGVLQSMNSLLLHVLCGPDADFIRKLLQVHFGYYMLYLLFLLIAMLVLLNMLTAMLCDVVSKSSDSSREANLLNQMEDQLSRLALALDADGDGRLDKEEFKEIMKDPLMVTSLVDLDVDIISVANFARFIYDQVDDISYADFILLVSRHRQSKLATGKDIMDLRHYLTMEVLELGSRMVNREDTEDADTEDA